jgi:hypothetical protein
MADTTMEFLGKDTAEEFLEEWISEYIAAEARSLEVVNETVAELLDDAAEANISREDLEKAAGGDLEARIFQAIKKYHGE